MIRRRKNPANLARQVLGRMVSPGEAFTRASLLAGLRASGALTPGRWVDDLLKDAVRQGVLRRRAGLYRMLNPNLTKKDIDFYDRVMAPYAFASNLKIMLGPGAELEKTPAGVTYLRRRRDGRRVAKFTFAKIGSLGIPDIKVTAVGFPRKILALLDVPLSIVTQEYRKAMDYVWRLLGIATGIRRRNPVEKGLMGQKLVRGDRVQLVPGTLGKPPFYEQISRGVVVEVVSPESQSRVRVAFDIDPKNSRMIHKSMLKRRR